MTPAATWEPKLMTLVTGELAFNDSEEWRRETEARNVLALEPHEQQEYLFTVEGKRSIEAAAALREAMRQVDRRCRTCGSKLVLASGYCSACTACLDESVRGMR